MSNDVVIGRRLERLIGRLIGRLGRSPHIVRRCSVLLLCAAAGTTWGGEPPIESKGDGAAATQRRSSLVQRGVAAQDGTPKRSDPASPRSSNRVPSGGSDLAKYPFEYRTIDGSTNNVLFPEWGSAGRAQLRLTPTRYGGDGTGGVPAGQTRPSAREVSNAVHAQTTSITNDAWASDLLWQWGQFIDHDIVETPFVAPAERFDIGIPAGDAHFDPNGTGTRTMALDRSAFDMTSGIRQQVNIITSFIDASMVYGSEEHRTDTLRTLDGTGRLRVSEGDLMPFNEEGLENADDAANTSLFLAGDIRANEQIALAAMHTLWVREHNWWADRFRAERPALGGDEIFERARAMVAAEIQAITYEQWLPLLIGADAMPKYTGYDPGVDPTISNVFAGAAFRVGHTMLSSTLKRLGPDMQAIDRGDISLADAFFNPSELMATGLEPVLRGLTSQKAQQIDRFIIDEVRNMLFGRPGSGGFDLASLNIQRGRDHGLASYNDVRVAFGLPALGSFDDVPADAAARAALASVYNSVHDVDAWTGMLCELPVTGALVGETLQTVMADQFRRLRDGDRFWYWGYLPSDLANEARLTTLADVIRRNTAIGDEIQEDVFRVLRGPCLADMNHDGKMTSDDVTEFVTDFLMMRQRADLNGNARWEATDVMKFVNSFLDGCDHPGSGG